MSPGQLWHNKCAGLSEPLSHAGNAAFAAKDYHAAVRQYSMASEYGTCKTVRAYKTVTQALTVLCVVSSCLRCCKSLPLRLGAGNAAFAAKDYYSMAIHYDECGTHKTVRARFWP